MLVLILWTTLEQDQRRSTVALTQQPVVYISETWLHCSVFFTFTSKVTPPSDWYGIEIRELLFLCRTEPAFSGDHEEANFGIRLTGLIFLGWWGNWINRRPIRKECREAAHVRCDPGSERGRD